MSTPSYRLAGLLAAVILIGGCVPAQATPTPTPTTRPTSAATPTIDAGPTPTLASSATPGTSASTGITLMPFVDGLAAPLDIALATDGSGRLYVAQQGGQIRIIDHGALRPTPFLDIADRITSGGERGLLGIAFHPEFAADPRVFVDYTDLNGNTVVSSFLPSLDADVADPDSEVQLLRVKQPYANHNGGSLAFGPDGKLYIGLGDGGSGGDPDGNGRNLKTLLAKILRIDVDVPEGSAVPYAIPADNPFAGRSTGEKPEIWLTGLRNPWRFRFDQATGDLWIGDVGQSAWEEIDVARAGASALDYGWNVMEGSHCYEPATGCDPAGLTLPVTEYGHDLGCAVVGGVVVRGSAEPALAGRYVFGDECSGRIWSIDAASDGLQTPRLEADTGRAISSFGLGPDGELYVTDLGSGAVLRATVAAG